MTIADDTVHRSTRAKDTIHRFTRAEYYKMVKVGIFAEKRVERIAGKILDMSPQAPPHSLATLLVNQFLSRHLPPNCFVRCQMPLSIAKSHDPEPDLAVIQGAIRDSRKHPTTAMLVVEVALDSLRRDRHKAAIYAKGAIPEYWIVDIRGRQIFQYSAPRPAAGSQRNRWEYAQLRALAETDVLTPLHIPLPACDVRQFLPDAPLRNQAAM